MVTNGDMYLLLLLQGKSLYLDKSQKSEYRRCLTEYCKDVGTVPAKKLLDILDNDVDQYPRISKKTFYGSLNGESIPFDLMVFRVLPIKS